VMDFRQGTSGWDWALAVQAGQPLVDAAVAGASWLPPDELREGLVVAQLQAGDPSGARRTFEALAPLSRRPPGDFRVALLASYVQAIEAQTPR